MTGAVTATLPTLPAVGLRTQGVRGVEGSFGHLRSRTMIHSLIASVHIEPLDYLFLLGAEEKSPNSRRMDKEHCNHFVFHEGSFRTHPRRVPTNSPQRTHPAGNAIACIGADPVRMSASVRGEPSR